MFLDHLLAKVLRSVALAALGLCFAPAAVAQFSEEIFSEDIFDPGAPPSEFPDHSGEMNNFGSKFLVFFSRIDGINFVPQAKINCSTCAFPVPDGSVHSFTLSGRVLGGTKPDNVPGDQCVPVTACLTTLGVYLLNVTVTGVKATVSPRVPRGDGTSDQTIKYTADLAAPFNAVLSGTLQLDSKDGEPNTTGLTPGPEATIKVAATASGPTPTEDLVLNVTFPAIPANSPKAMGQAVAANVVLQLEQKLHLRLP